jgi:hypothetical protein
MRLLALGMVLLQPVHAAGRIVGQAYSPEHPLKVLLIGDSMMQGLQFELKPMINQHPAMTAEDDYKVSSGLCNSGFLDWPAHAASLTRSKHYDAVVVWIGPNDTQGIRTNGRSYPFGSDGWKQLYLKRATSLASVLVKQAGALYWLGLPRMREAGYDQQMRTVTELHARACAAVEGATYLPATVLNNEHGNYTPTLTVRGRRVLVRAFDGIHPAPAGSRLVSEVVVQRLKADLLEKPPPTEKEQHCAAGLAAKRAGRSDLARQELRQALALDADYLEAHWVMAWVAAGLGDDGAAAREFEHVMRLAPDSQRARSAWVALARLAASRRPLPAEPTGGVALTGLTDANTAPVAPPTAPGTPVAASRVAELVASALAAKRTGDLVTAETLLRQALAADSEHVEAHWVLAWVLASTGQREAAREHFLFVAGRMDGTPQAEEARSAMARLEP